MHIQVEIADFDFSEFMSDHNEDLVVIASAGWRYQIDTGFCRYRTRYKGKRTHTRQKAFEV